MLQCCQSLFTYALPNTSWQPFGGKRGHAESAQLKTIFVKKSEEYKCKSFMEMSGLTYREINGDLFKCQRDYSMCHCVAADLRMGRGIAVKFR